MVWQGQTSLLIKTGNIEILSQKNPVIFSIKILSMEQKSFVIIVRFSVGSEMKVANK